MVSFLVRKASTLACRRWLAATSFSSWSCSCACCAWRSEIWRGQAGAAGQRLAGEVLAAAGERGLGLLLELGALLLELGDLQLETLAAGGHVGHAAAHLLQQLELLLVGVVQRLARVLRLVQGLVRLGLEDQGEALPEAHRGAPLPWCDSWGNDVRGRRTRSNLSATRRTWRPVGPPRPPSGRPGRALSSPRPEMSSRYPSGTPARCTDSTSSGAPSATTARGRPAPDRWSTP